MSFTTFEQADREAKKREAKRNPFASEMSMRDHFAAKAMQAILGQYDFTFFEDDKREKEGNTFALVVAKNAYAMADAMLRAREAA
jgi:hypothetical protein